MALLVFVGTQLKKLLQAGPYGILIICLIILVIALLSLCLAFWLRYKKISKLYFSVMQKSQVDSNSQSPKKRSGWIWGS